MQGWEAAFEQATEPGRCWEWNGYSHILPQLSVDASRAGGDPGAAYYLLQPFPWVLSQLLQITTNHLI